MQVIKVLTEDMEEELDDAEKYAISALRYKEKDTALGKIFYDLSLEETRHYNMLHDYAVRLINDYKSQGKTVPESMQSIYDFLHERFIEESNEIKLYQTQYKES